MFLYFLLSSNILKPIKVGEVIIINETNGFGTKENITHATSSNPISFPKSTTVFLIKGH